MSHCVCVCVEVYLMSGYLDTSVLTSRNSSVGSVSLNTSAMAAMAPQRRSVSSPYMQQPINVRHDVHMSTHCCHHWVGRCYSQRPVSWRGTWTGRPLWSSCPLPPASHLHFWRWSSSASRPWCTPPPPGAGPRSSFPAHAHSKHANMLKMELVTLYCLYHSINLLLTGHPSLYKQTTREGLAQLCE